MALESGGGGSAGSPLDRLLARLRSLLGDQYQDQESSNDEAIHNLVRYFALSGGDDAERDEELISLSGEVGGQVATTSSSLWPPSGRSGSSGLDNVSVTMDGLNGGSISLGELLRNTNQDLADDGITRLPSAPTADQVSSSRPETGITAPSGPGESIVLPEPTRTGGAEGGGGGAGAGGGGGGAGAGGGPLGTIEGGPDFVVDNKGKYFIINPTTQTRYDVGAPGSGSYDAAVALYGPPRNVNTMLTGWNRGGSAVTLFGGPNAMEEVYAGLRPDPFTGELVPNPGQIISANGTVFTPEGWNADYNGVPSGAEVWKIGNTVYLVYQAEPGGARLMYNIPDMATYDRIFAGSEPQVREMTREEANRLGGITVGSTNLLTSDLESSWLDGFNATIDREASLSPWLNDPEVIGVILAATLEGRQVTDAELESTDYFGSRSDAEIAYIQFAAQATPEELDQYTAQHHDVVRQFLTDAGVRSPDETLVNFMSMKWASGEWSDAYLSRQIMVVSNPYSSLEMDTELASLLDGTTLDTLSGQSRAVEDLVRQWLGPQHTAGFSDEWYRQWAGSILDDPNAEDDLIEYLQGQRLALYPEYDNPNLRYSDIAPVWENYMTQQWGIQPTDESSWGVLDKLIRMNDADEAGKYLRREGLNRGVGTVEENLYASTVRSLGTGIINPVSV